MKYHVVFGILGVISLCLLFLYNLVLLSPRKPVLRLTQRDSFNWTIFEEKRQTQQWAHETTAVMQENTETSENKLRLQVETSLAGPQTDAPRRNLIILSPGRGGSSFLGGLFDSNPQVMYWFEPLHTIHREIFQTDLFKEKSEPIAMQYKKTCNGVIDSFFTCDFSNIAKATLSNFSNSIFRYRSKSLTSGYLCSPGRSTSRKCRPFTGTLLSKTCKSTKHTVIKILTSRVPNKTLLSFQKLFEQDSYDVKLIHLVRDPRAVIYSMVDSVQWIEKKDFLAQDFRLHIHGICDSIIQYITMGLLYPPSWLRYRFKVIRFEDLVVDTVKHARELYSFAGFDWSMSVEKWISAHDRPPSNAKEGKPYSLYRNASEVIDKWKSAPEDLIRAVEETCGDLMDMLGYEKWLT